MDKKWLKGLIAVLLCVLIPSNVFAATLYSNWYSIPASELGYDPANVSYQYRAALRIDTRYAQGTAQIYGDKQIPQSYVGALAQIYSSSGQLLNSSNWKYNNDGPVTNHAVTIGYNGTGTMYCKATFGVWANTKEKIYSAKTSNGIVKSSETLPENKINESGKVYGSGLSDSPIDLILTLGDNGNVGYVYAEDLYGAPAQSREEFIAKMNSPAKKTIPVYDENGMTIVDYFTMGE